ncbi:MAG TPA: hypothetical protein VIH36_16420 [Casimicrobiaceae bacterium]|jgi:hypothetical protein
MNRPIRTYAVYSQPQPIARTRVVTPLLVVFAALVAWAAWIYLPILLPH